MTVQTDAFSQFEYEGWERVAERYESAWSGLTTLFIPHLLQAASIGPGKRVLDVATGPGYVAEAAQKEGATVVGVDFSPEMVRLARQRNPDIEFQTGDAQELNFENDSFEAVLMNFGVLHLSNPETAFGEALRVLRPGGTFAFTIWAGPEDSQGAKVVGDAIGAYAKIETDLPEGPDYYSYGEPAECSEILGRIGFDRDTLEFRTEKAEWKVPTASFVFEAERDAGVRTAALLAVQSAETLEAIKAEIERQMMQFAHGGEFIVPFAAHIIAVKSPSVSV